MASSTSTGGVSQLVKYLEPLLSREIRPLGWSNVAFALIIPFAPLGLQAYYLQFHGTRPIRIAFAVVGIAIIADAAMTYRILVPEYNALNVAMHVAYLHIFGKYVEFASLSDPVIDPYLAKGRSRLLSAWDLSINSRWIGLRPIFQEEVRDAKREARHDHSSKSQPNGSEPASNGKAVTNGNGKKATDTAPRVDQSRWLKMPTTRRTRLEATLRHLALYVQYYAIVDTLLLFMRVCAHDSVGSVIPPPKVWDKFLSTPWTVFPHTPLAWRLPPWIIIVLTEMWTGGVIWQTLCMGYHFFALLAVGSGLWEVESWEVDLMYSPWKCDSLLDLWGRGWHQLFRHHFLTLSIFLLRLLRLPPRGPLLLPLIFFWSAALHVIAGHVMLARIPGKNAWDLIPTGAFFLLSGLGCALELAFRQITGRRVKGNWGRVWLWSWLCLSALPGARSWLEAGICGNLLTGPGWAGWAFLPLVRRVIDVVR